MATAAPAEPAVADRTHKLRKCRRCANHGENFYLGNHRCPRKNCRCVYCFLIEERTRIKGKVAQLMAETVVDCDCESLDSKGQNMCLKCRLHGIIQVSKDHKCCYEIEDCECECSRCLTVDYCRFVEASQRELTRDQDTGNNKRKRRRMHPSYSGNLFAPQPRNFCELRLPGTSTGQVPLRPVPTYPCATLFPLPPVPALPSLCCTFPVPPLPIPCFTSSIFPLVHPHATTLPVPCVHSCHHEHGLRIVGCLGCLSGLARNFSDTQLAFSALLDS